MAAGADGAAPRTRRSGGAIGAAAVAPLVVAALLSGGTARADGAVNVLADRALAPPGPGVTFAAEGGETLPRGEVEFAVRLGALGRPWVLRNGLTGETVAVPVERAFTFEMTAAIGLADRLQIALAQPVTMYQTGDRLRGVVDDRALQATAAGDVRLHLKAEMARAEVAGGRAALCFAPFVAAPSGNYEQFAGVGSFWGELRLAGGWRGRGLLLAADLGVRLRSPTTFYGVNLDTAALAFAVGAAWTVPGRLLRGRLTLIADLDGESYGPGRPVPAEARGGARVRLWRGVSVAAAGGASVGREPGAPSWRALLELRVAPQD